MARTHGHGNPDWTRDETILALGLYFECDGKIPQKDDQRVLELSKFLRSLPYHNTPAQKESFRNPTGVAFKLQNLRQVATGKGLSNVSEMDRKVWAEFGSHPEKVKEITKLIREGVKIAEALQGLPDNDECDEFLEGKIITEIHKRRERDPKVRKHLLAKRRKTGVLSCDICSVRPPSVDLKFEDAIFEAHHLIPISTTSERKTNLKDVSLLCANCHRLLHRIISSERRWIGIPEGRQIIGLLIKM